MPGSAISGMKPCQILRLAMTAAQIGTSLAVSAAITTWETATAVLKGTI